jgi:hypothetical protein
VPDLEHVAKPFGSEKGGSGALALDQRIGGERRPMDDQADLAALAITERKAASTPASGACAVVRIFSVNRRSDVSSATSVKVPPMSTPTLIVDADVTRERSSRYPR